MREKIRAEGRKRKHKERQGSRGFQAARLERVRLIARRGHVNMRSLNSPPSPLFYFESAARANKKKMIECKPIHERRQGQKSPTEWQIGAGRDVPQSHELEKDARCQDTKRNIPLSWALLLFMSNFVPSLFIRRSFSLAIYPNVPTSPRAREKDGDGEERTDS